MMVMTRGAQRRLEDLCTLRNKYGAGIQRTGVNYAAYCTSKGMDVYVQTLFIRDETNSLYRAVQHYSDDPVKEKFPLGPTYAD
jgi:hypothetical protein